MTPSPTPRSAEGASRESDPLRRALMLVGLLVALGVLLAAGHRHYPLQDWLFFRYAGYWLLAGTWSIACGCAGHFTLRALLGRSLPVLEQLAVAFPLGVFEFQLAMFGLGLLRGYGAIAFFALPAALLALGLPAVWRHAAGLRAAGLGRVLARRAPSPLACVALAFGCVLLVAIYLPTMIPGNVSFDARWRHMMLAEQYVVHGGLRRFPEGWAFAASPQFSVLLYAWGFMLPGSVLFDRIELCAHIETVCFLWTTWFGVPALVRRLSPGANPITVWVARLLFPGVLLYDSSLSGGTDHLGAVFAPALFLAGLEFWRRANLRSGLLLGILLGAVVCAKETTGLLLGPAPILLVCARLVQAICPRQRDREQLRSVLLGAVVCAGSALALSSPYWLKNLIWYGNPVYPSLAGWFWPRPWIANAPYIIRWPFLELGLWSAPLNLQGLQQLIAVWFNFAFVPHDWWTMHRNVPVFGFLFTLLLIVLPFLRRTRRIWLLVVWVQVAISVWFVVHHEDRYLQTVMPWMAAVTGAIIVRIVRTQRRAARAVLYLLIAAQAVWGADVYFYPTHQLLDQAPIRATADLLAQGYLRNYQKRFEIEPAQQAVAASVPREAVLLVHESRGHLGFERTTVTDFYGDQYGIDYATLETPERIDARLREMNVTHLVWFDRTSIAYAPLAGDIAFFDFAYLRTRERRTAGGYRVARMPKRPLNAVTPPRWVAIAGCGHEYASGVYLLSDLTVPRFGPARHDFPKPRRPLPGNPVADKEISALVVDSACHPQPEGSRKFVHVAHRAVQDGGSYELWLRKRR